jgi:hypothetical protein
MDSRTTSSTESIQINKVLLAGMIMAGSIQQNWAQAMRSPQPISQGTIKTYHFL